jgi:beta-phosphoglucomutase-like phosphatase (HAD superfamily)
MPYQGIIFDFNGVLWWDNALQAQAWRRFSARVRGTPLSDEEMAVHVHGRNNPHTLSYLAGRPVEGQELARLIEEKEAIYRRLCLDLGGDFRLSPGAPALLDLLAAQGIPRTIATASGRANVDFFVAHLGLDRWFEVERIVYDDGHLPGKPAPDMYRRAAANLGLAPARCIVVEDSRSGIQAARAAGIGHVIGLGPSCAQPGLRQLGADVTLSSLAEFPVEQLLQPE